MNLDFRTSVKIHEIQNLGVILKFCDAVIYNLPLRGIEQDELIGMHRHSHVVSSYLLPDIFKVTPEEFYPIGLADWMGSERDQIRGDSEEENVFRFVVIDYFLKTCKIGPNGFDQSYFAVGC